MLKTTSLIRKTIINFGGIDSIKSCKHIFLAATDVWRNFFIRQSLFGGPLIVIFIGPDAHKRVTIHALLYSTEPGPYILIGETDARPF